MSATEDALTSLEKDIGQTLGRAGINGPHGSGGKAERPKAPPAASFELLHGKMLYAAELGRAVKVLHVEDGFAMVRFCDPQGVADPLAVPFCLPLNRFVAVPSF